VFGLLTGWFSYKFLATHDIAWDVRAEAAVELTTIFWLVTMASGILFSELEWGLWWQWDPRQTSFLLVLLIYFAYFALRGSFSDDVRKATHSAAYYLAALGPTLFLIYVFPRLPQIAQSSFHPTQSIMQGQIKGEYAYIILATLTLASIVAAWLYRLRVKAGLLLLEEPSYGNLETDRSDTAHPPVVRPIRVPDESRE
jgi:heme exporter protein C